MTHRHLTCTPAWHEWWEWLLSAPACQSFVQNTSRDPIQKEDTEIISTANIHACYGSNSTTNQSRSRNVSVQWGYMVGAYAVQIVFAIVEHQRYRVCEVLVSTKLVHVWILCEYVCVWLWWCVHIVVCDCVYTYMWRCTLVECAAVYSWHTS